MAARHDNVKTRRMDAFDSTPGVRVPMARGYRCCDCNAIFKDRRMPGDRGSFGARNRARAALIKHWNERHYPNEAKRAVIRWLAPEPSQ